jgi:hypothetical protein
MEVTINHQSEGSMPVQISIWDPLTSDSFSVYFLFPDTVYVGTRKSIDKWESIIEVGKYSINSTYRLSILFKPNSVITFTFSNSTWSNTIVIKNATILERPMVNLSIFASSKAGSIATLKNYRVIIPTQTYYNYFVGSLKDILYIIYACIAILAIFAFRSEFCLVFNKTRGLVKNIKYFIRTRKESYIFFAILLFSFLLQAFLSTVGSHPYDMFTQKIWAYIISYYGLGGLYPISLITPSGRASGKPSIVNSYYPYPPLLGYYYMFIGKIYSSFYPSFEFNTPYLSFLIKLPLIIITLFVGCLIFSFIKKKVGLKFALLLMLIFTVNPALILNTVVWGQNDIFLALFLICSLLTFKISVTASLFFLILSLLTKQTAIPPVVLMLILMIKKYGFKKILTSITFPLTCIFLLLFPYLYSGYSLLFIINVSIGDKVFNKIAREQALGIPEWQKVVSGGAYNIWPIMTFVFNHQLGWSRFTYPDFSSNQIFRTTYNKFGLYLTSFFFILILLLSLISSKTRNDNEEAKIAYMLYLIVFSSYLFLTRMHERYLFLTIPFLIIAFPWIKNKKIFIMLYGSLTLTFFLSIYAILSLTATWVPQFLPNFIPNANPFNSLAFLFTSNDFLISTLSIVNILIFTFSLCFAFLKILCMPIGYRIQLRLFWGKKCNRIN